MVDKLVMQRDIEKPIQVYKVLMSQVRGYYIDVAATNAEEAMEYAELNKNKNIYKEYENQVVETVPVEVIGEWKHIFMLINIR